MARALVFPLMGPRGTKSIHCHQREGLSSLSSVRLSKFSLPVFISPRRSQAQPPTPDAVAQADMHGQRRSRMTSQLIGSLPPPNCRGGMPPRLNRTTGPCGIDQLWVTTWSLDVCGRGGDDDASRGDGGGVRAWERRSIPVAGAEMPCNGRGDRASQGIQEASRSQLETPAQAITWHGPTWPRPDGIDGLGGIQRGGCVGRPPTARSHCWLDQLRRGTVGGSRSRGRQAQSVPLQDIRTSFRQSASRRDVSSFFTRFMIIDVTSATVAPVLFPSGPMASSPCLSRAVGDPPGDSW
jgi:hypothetical protein